MAGENGALFKGSALVATIAAAAALATGQPALSAFFINFAASYTLGKWSQRQAAKAYTQEVVERRAMIRSATAPQRVIYGNVVVSGAVVYAQVTGADKEYLHLVVALAGHEIHSVGDIWFEDQLLGDRDASGNVTTGTFAGLARIKVHLGGSTQAADSDLVSESAGKWTANHQGQGIAYLYARIKWDMDKFPTGIPTIRALVRGRPVYDPRDGSTRLTANPALLMRDYLTAPFGIGCSASEIDDTRCATSADLCDQWVDTGVTGLAVTPDAATDTFALAQHDPRIATGDRCVLGGSTAPAGLTLGATYYLVRSGRTTVRLASSAQNALEGATLTFTSAGSGVVLNSIHQRRYTAHGSFTLDAQPDSVEEGFRTAMAGSTVIAGGLWRIFAGAYAAPGAGATLTTDDLRGAVVYSPRRGRHDLVNQLRGVYTDMAQAGTAVEFPPVTSATFVSQDGGETISRQVEYTWATDSCRSQRLAKIALRRNRVASLAVPCKIGAMRLATSETVSVTLPQLGLVDAVFRVTGWKISGADGGIGIDLALEADAAEIYDWATADAVTPAVNSGLSIPDYRIVGAPTGLTLASGSAQLLKLADGTIVSRLLATWTHAVEPNPVSYEVQYQRGSEAWNSVTISRDQNALYLSPVEDGATYTVRVRTLNALGVRSAWVTGTHVVAGKSAAPTAPTSLSVAPAVGGFDIAWSANPDPDYLRSEVWESATNDRSTATLVAQISGNRFARAGLGAGVTRWYWVRDVDTSGNVSNWYPASATAGVSATTSAVSGGITPVATLPASGMAEGDVVYLTTADKLYRYDGSAWVTWVDGADILAATVTAGKISVATLEAIQTNTGDLTVDATGAVHSSGSTWASGVGFWMGYNGAAYKLRIGNPAGANLAWDGTALTFTGALSGATGTFAGALSAATGSFGAVSADGAVTVSATGHIKGGQSAYNTGSGFFLGYSSGAYKFSIGSPTQGITWDGSALTITGQVVATGNLLSNAVTNVRSSYTAAGAAASSSWTTYASVSITTVAGSPVIVWISGYISVSTQFQIRIYRNGTLLAEIPPGFAGGSAMFSHVLTDTPGAGTHTYQWQLADFGFGGASVYSRSIVAMETKR